MRWVVEIPDPSGGTAATVTVEARSWLEGLTKARGGVALAKYHAEIDDDGLVRVLDRNTRDRFTVRPMKSIGPDAARAASPAPEAPLLFSSPPPADSIFNTGENRAAPAPTPPTSSSPPAAASTPPPGDKGTLLSHRAVYALGSEPSQSLTGAHAAARGGRGPRRSPSSSETPRVHIPAPQPNARKSPAPAATDSSPPGERPSQPRAAEAPPSSVVALALDYASQAHEGARPEAKPAEATPSRPELPPPPEPEPPAAPEPPAVAQAPAEPATPPAPAAHVPDAAAALLAAVPDNNRSDTMVVPTVTAHDGIVEPLPVPTVLFERDEEPGPGHPIAYRERVFAVAAGTTRERAEALARQSFAAIKRALSSRPRGRFVTIAVFDEEFTSRPSVPPLVVLEWKDWRGDPSVQYPDSLPPPEPEAPAVSAPPPPVAAPEPPAPVPAAAPEPPAPVEAPAPAPAAAEAPAAEAERPKRARVPTESDISMVEVVPPPVPMAAIPSDSDISMVEVLPPATPAAAAPAPPTPAPAPPRPAPAPPTPAPAPPQPAPPQPAPSVVTPATPSKAHDARSKKDKKRKRNRTSSESSISTTTARLASIAQTPQTPAERDAPTVVVPVYQAPDAKPAPEAAKPAPEEAAKPAPEAAKPAPEEAAPTPSTPREAPAAEAAPASPTPPETPAAATPAPSPEAPQAAPAPAPTETAAPAPEAPKEPAAPAEAPAPSVSLAKEPEAPAATPAPAAEPAPSVSLAKEPEAPAKEPEAPAKPASEKPPVPTRSTALTAKRRRGKELVGDLFEALMDLSFTQTSEDACSFAARVLHEYVVCDGCSVALYDIDRDEFVVAASEGVSIVGDRDTAGRGSRTLAVRRRAAVNMKRGDAAEGLADFLAGGPSVFVPAFHRDRLFAMAVLQRMPGAPFFESDEEDGATYVASQLAEALAAHSKRAGAKQLDDEHRASIAPKRR